MGQECLLLVWALRCAAGGHVTPAALGDESAEVEVLPVPLPLLTAISTLRVSIPSDLRTPDSRRAGASSAGAAPGCRVKCRAAHVGGRCKRLSSPAALPALACPCKSHKHAHVSLPAPAPVPPRAVLLTLRELVKRYPGGRLPELDPIHDAGCGGERVLAAAEAREALQRELEANPVHKVRAGAPGGGAGPEAGGVWGSV